MVFFREDNDVLVCPKCGETDKTNAGSMKTNYVLGSGIGGKPFRCSDLFM